ncbi:MAG: PAS domain S-box protein [Acidobacteriota bacterium]
MRAPLPANEAERLEALRRCRILDTPPEAAFDRLTHLAAYLLKVPVAAVGLLDSDRQWLKSCYGREVRETERSVAFAAHAILSKTVTVVSDTTSDPRTADNPMVTGEPHYRFYAGAPLRSADGYEIGCLCLFDYQPRDLTDDERALLEDLAAIVVDELELRLSRDEALNEQRQYLAALTESSPLAVVTLDPDHCILDCNLAFEELFLYRCDEIIGKPLDELIVPAGLASEASELTQSVQGGTRVHREVLRRRKDGSLIEVEVFGVPVPVEGKQVGIYGIYQDLTARKQLEKQLQLSQKMEAIGQMAGGVAHEFNNLLTGITGYVSLVLGNLDEDSPASKDLLKVRELGTRAASLTQQLLSFGRRQPLEPAVLDLNSLIGTTSEVIRPLIGEDIELVVTADPHLHRVRAEGSMIEQVLMNLAVNARDAMPEGGTLTIETANVTLDQDFADTHPDVALGNYAVVKVSDSGCGMDEATQARIFEPFFTTKEVGEGTGLGLSAAYGIIEQHGGFISVDSEPAAGSQLTIYLPSVDGVPAHPEMPPAERSKATPSTPETILVVEDEEAVRAVAERALGGRGYTVYSAAHPDEAEELYAQHSEEIGLLLTDVVMPGRSGPELYRRLVEKSPDLKVLYMSGYRDRDGRKGDPQDSLKPFLRKPFTLDELLGGVAEALAVANSSDRDAKAP